MQGVSRRVIVLITGDESQVSDRVRNQPSIAQLTLDRQALFEERLRVRKPATTRCDRLQFVECRRDAALIANCWKIGSASAISP